MNVCTYIYALHSICTLVAICNEGKKLFSSMENIISHTYLDLVELYTHLVHSSSNIIISEFILLHENS